MSKSKNKIKSNRIKPIYFKLFGSAWVVVLIFLLAKTGALKTFGVMFFGGNVCGSCTQVGLLSLVLCFLILAIGASSLAYGVLLTEATPSPTPGRIVALTCAIAAAGLAVFGWINFAINY